MRSLRRLSRPSGKSLAKAASIPAGRWCGAAGREEQDAPVRWWLRPRAGTTSGMCPGRGPVKETIWLRPYHEHLRVGQVAPHAQRDELPHLVALAKAFPSPSPVQAQAVGPVCWGAGRWRRRLRSWFEDQAGPAAAALRREGGFSVVCALAYCFSAAPWPLSPSRSWAWPLPLGSAGLSGRVRVPPLALPHWS